MRYSSYQAELKSELENLQFDLIGQHGGWRRVSLGVMRDGSLNAPDEELVEIREWMRENLLNLKAAVQPWLEKVMRELPADDAAENRGMPIPMRRREGRVSLHSKQARRGVNAIAGQQEEN